MRCHFPAQVYFSQEDIRMLGFGWAMPSSSHTLFIIWWGYTIWIWTNGDSMEIYYITILIYYISVEIIWTNAIFWILCQSAEPDDKRFRPKVRVIYPLWLVIIWTGWWFGSFFIFHNIWDNPSHWLIFFKMVKATNQLLYGVIYAIFH